MTKILLVDDDLLILATISLGLRQKGYEVLQTDDSSSALEICREEKPDLVLLDIRMPNLNGIDLAKVFMQEKIHFIFLSAFSDEEMLSLASSTGALGYLVKPLEIAQIVPAIEIALVRADELYKTGKSLENIANALEKNREIDIAIGIVMERHHISRADSFERIRTFARSRRLKIIDVAKAVIDGLFADI
jgi:response regulator NasT